MGDTTNISLWCAYVMSAFRIRIDHALRCNVSPEEFPRLLVKPLPQVWKDIFAIWFEMHYVPITCSDKSKKDLLLDSMVCYCEPVAECFDNIEIEDTIHAFLVENGFYTWRLFLDYFDERIVPIQLVYTDIMFCIIRIKINIPEMWKFIFEEDTLVINIPEMWKFIFEEDTLVIPSTAPRPTLCLDGITTAKECYQYLVSQKCTINDAAITQWTVDLEIAGIRENWSKICSKLNVVRNPGLQDFARSFLHRRILLKYESVLLGN